MTKRNAGDSPNWMRTTIGTIGNLDAMYWPFASYIRRIVANFRAKNAEGSPEFSDAGRQTGLTITQQAYVALRSECVDRGCGVYQPSLRYTHGDPLDQLLRPNDEEAEDSKSQAGQSQRGLKR